MRYLVKAVRGEHGVTDLALEAGSPEAARALAVEQGYAVIGVRAPGGSVQAMADRILRRERFPTTLFAVELLALLKAGLNAGEAVRALTGAHAGSRHAGRYERIQSALDAGQRLSSALEMAVADVPALLVASLRAAERTSDLEAALSRYVTYANRIEAVRRQVAAVLTYPAILLLVGIAVTGFLLLYVVPRFAGIYEEVSGDIPFFSALLLSAGHWVNQHGVAAGVLVITVLAAGAFLLAHPALRTRLAPRMWLPQAVRERVAIFHLARLYRSLGMLLRSGVPFVEALAMSAALLPQRLRPAAGAACDRLREGLPISAAFGSAGLTTSIAVEMLAVGERTGEMGAMLERIADFHDEALSRWLETAMRVFEPALMAVLGIVIGAIVVLMWVFRLIVTGCFGVVTDRFGIVTGDSGGS